MPSRERAASSGSSRRSSGARSIRSGSKSNEATMQKMVVEMKDELEKIKEQVLNIL